MRTGGFVDEEASAGCEYSVYFKSTTSDATAEEDGQGGEENVAQTKLYAEDRRLGDGVCAQATSAEHGK